MPPDPADRRTKDLSDRCDLDGPLPHPDAIVKPDKVVRKLLPHVLLFGLGTEWRVSTRLFWLHWMGHLDRPFLI